METSTYSHNIGNNFVHSSPNKDSFDSDINTDFSSDASREALLTSESSIDEPDAFDAKYVPHGHRSSCGPITDPFKIVKKDTRIKWMSRLSNQIEVWSLSLLLGKRPHCDQFRYSDPFQELKDLVDAPKFIADSKDFLEGIELIRLKIMDFDKAFWSSKRGPGARVFPSHIYALTCSFELFVEDLVTLSPLYEPLFFLRRLKELVYRLFVAALQYLSKYTKLIVSSGPSITSAGSIKKHASFNAVIDACEDICAFIRQKRYVTFQKVIDDCSGRMGISFRKYFPIFKHMPAYESNSTSDDLELLSQISKRESVRNRGHFWALKCEIMQKLLAMISKRLGKRISSSRLDDIVHHAQSLTYAVETLLFQLDTRKRYDEDTKDHANDADDSFDSLQRILEDCERDKKLGAEWRHEWISMFSGIRDSLEKFY
ncbi:hypothetical protein OXX59_007815 [Metschnikowia pulcherrima]